MIKKALLFLVFVFGLGIDFSHTAVGTVLSRAGSLPKSTSPLLAASCRIFPTSSRHVVPKTSWWKHNRAAFWGASLLGAAAYYRSWPSEKKIHDHLFGDHKAEPLHEVQYAWIHEMIRHLCIDAGIVVPRLLLQQTEKHIDFAIVKYANTTVFLVQDGVLELANREKIIERLTALMLKAKDAATLPAFTNELPYPVISPTEHPWLHEKAEAFCKELSLPEPKLLLISTPKIVNAFASASGIDQKESFFLITDGIIEQLSREELRAIIGHEISHIKNRDTFLLPFIGIAMQIFAGGYIGYRMGDAYKNLMLHATKAIARVLALGKVGIHGLRAWLVAQVLSTLIVRSFCQSREYLADETGAKISKDPKSLATALEKLLRLSKGDSREIMLAQMQQAYPSVEKGFRLVTELTSTHPPLEARIKRLEAMPVLQQAKEDELA